MHPDPKGRPTPTAREGPTEVGSLRTPPTRPGRRKVDGFPTVREKGLPTSRGPVATLWTRPGWSQVLLQGTKGGRRTRKWRRTRRAGLGTLVPCPPREESQGYRYGTPVDS